MESYMLTVDQKNSVERTFDNLLDACLTSMRLRVLENSVRWWQESLTPDNKLFLSVASKTGSKNVIQTTNQHCMDVAAPSTIGNFSGQTIQMRYRYNYRIGAAVSATANRSRPTVGRGRTLALPDISGQIGVPLIEEGHPLYKEMLEVVIEVARLHKTHNMLCILTERIHRECNSVGQLQRCVPDVFTLLSEDIVGRASQYTRKPQYPKYFIAKIREDKQREALIPDVVHRAELWRDAEHYDMSCEVQPSTSSRSHAAMEVRNYKTQDMLDLLSEWLGKGLLAKAMLDRNPEGMRAGGTDDAPLYIPSYKFQQLIGEVLLDASRDTDRLPSDEQ